MKTKQLIITIALNDNNEMIVNTEQENLTRLEILGMIEQVKHLVLTQEVEEPIVPLSDVIEKKEDNIIPLNS